jgi:hypothetical protein
VGRCANDANPSWKDSAILSHSWQQIWFESVPDFANYYE